MTLVRVVLDPADDPDLPPVCSCCRMRALRERGTGRICPDCDSGDTTVPDMPNRPPPRGTTGGV